MPAATELLAKENAASVPVVFDLSESTYCPVLLKKTVASALVLIAACAASLYQVKASAEVVKPETFQMVGCARLVTSI